MWVSGGYNYILPFALGLYSLSNLIHEKHRTLSVSLVALYFSCNNEQFGAVALLVIAITTAIRKHKKSSIKYEIIYLVTAAVSFIANMLAPETKRDSLLRFQTGCLILTIYLCLIRLL